MESTTLQKIDYQSFFEKYFPTKATHKMYIGCFEQFLNYFSLSDANYLLTLSKEQTYKHLEQYVSYLVHKKNQGTLKVNSIRPMLSGIIQFFELNDVPVNRKKLYKMIPENVKNGGNKAYTKNDLRLLLKSTTKSRNRFIVLFMASTGCRVGAISQLTLSNITKMDDCYSVTLYNEEKQEYLSFMSPECSREYERYLETRKAEGEAITNNSPLVRNDYSAGKQESKTITAGAIYDIVSRMVRKTGIARTKKGRRYDLATDHAFRKFFATSLKLNPQISDSVAERLMGHMHYLDPSYFDPRPEVLFEYYKKAIPDLTVDENEAKNVEIKTLRSQINNNEPLEYKMRRLEQIVKNAMLELTQLRKQKLSVS